jgi:hypothetical protein
MVSSWERVHTNHSTSAEGTCAVMYAQCLCKALSQDCRHGEFAFSNNDINKKMCDKIENDQSAVKNATQQEFVFSTLEIFAVCA